MADKALSEKASQELTPAAEGAAAWKELVDSTWNLVNLQVGLKNVEPRMKNLLSSLHDLQSLAQSAEDPSTLSVIESEMRRLSACMERCLADFDRAKPIIENTLRVIWNKKKT